MITIETFRKLALSFPDTTEQPHFEKISFRFGKKIFATYDEKNNRACIKLSETAQDVFSVFDRTIFYPVPNKWGQQGWTFVDLKTVPKKMFVEGVTTAYHQVANKESRSKNK